MQRIFGVFSIARSVVNPHVPYCVPQLLAPAVYHMSNPAPDAYQLVRYWRQIASSRGSMLACFFAWMLPGPKVSEPPS